jgi:hypothetical protein
MRLVKRFGVFVVGIVIGVVVTVAAQSVRAQQQASGLYRPDNLQSNSRLTMIGSGKGGGVAYEFLADSQSGGCWFVVLGQDGGKHVTGSVAVAPPQACAK